MATDFATACAEQTAKCRNLQAALYFANAYTETACWTEDFDELDLAMETAETMFLDALTFFAAHEMEIVAEGNPQSQDMASPNRAARCAAMAGHDLWLTRNGHGAGFWDGDWPEPAASVLDKAATDLGTIDLYRGDDGAVYST